MNPPTKEELKLFVAHSNRIEGEPDEPGRPLFDDHLSAAMCAMQLTYQDVRLLGSVCL